MKVWKSADMNYTPLIFFQITLHILEVTFFINIL